MHFSSESKARHKKHAEMLITIVLQTILEWLICKFSMNGEAQIQKQTINKKLESETLLMN